MTKIETRSDRSRKRILDAAEAILRETGFDAAKVEQIATRAGVARKTIYNLFGTKADLADACIARVGARAEPLYGPAIRANAAAIPLLETILRDSADWCMANPDLALRALAPRIRPSEAPSEEPSFQGIVVEAMRLGQAQGVIRHDETPEFLALVLLGLYGQAMLTAIARSRLDPAQVGRIVRITVEGIGVQQG